MMSGEETLDSWSCLQTRRHFLGRSAPALSWAALGSLLQPGLLASAGHAPKAKHIIVLFMSGGPSHVDLFDHKPALATWDGHPLPDEIAKGIHFAQISRQAGRPKLKASPYAFRRCGQSGTWVSDLLPHLSDVAGLRNVCATCHGLGNSRHADLEAGGMQLDTMKCTTCHAVHQLQ